LRGWWRCKTQLALAPDFGGWIPKKKEFEWGKGFSEARDLEGSLVSDKPNWTKNGMEHCFSMCQQLG
jgi:hypothetical protein